MLLVAVAAVGCGSSGDTGSVEVGQASAPPKPASHSQPPATRHPDRRQASIIDSFKARLVNQHVVRLHWDLGRPAKLTLTAKGVRNGSTKNQTSGGWGIYPPPAANNSQPWGEGTGTHRVNFEYGEYNFHGYDRLQFRLRARSTRGAHDTSQPIVLSRPPGK